MIKTTKTSAISCLFLLLSTRFLTFFSLPPPHPLPPPFFLNYPRPKVLIAPQAVVADGGAVCSSGHLMVAVAAKEFSVPVVGVTGTYMLTPLFAHNQLAALGQLLSPAGVIGYDALDPEAFDNVEVVVPAFDTLPPDLLALYVTNNGSHQVLCY
jgi:translation initiation factor 2B subunit (eIF-2B alpha/beta/delta family)